MATSLFRTTPTLRAALRAGSIKPRVASLAGTSFVRGKVTLPDLPYDYSALEPHISGQIMELHHSGHHQTYVNNVNKILDLVEEAKEKGNDKKVKHSHRVNYFFNNGGHINHSLFWENLAPSGNGGGGEPEGALKTAIEKDFGSFEDLQKEVNTTLAGIQGSGWAWLVRDTEAKKLKVVKTSNQNIVLRSHVPLMGIDAWEHAYYLQYQNRKAEYFNAIWNVINWSTVANRLEKAEAGKVEPPPVDEVATDVE
ncbi:Superoxide dismutase [Mn], mitochondrial [Diatrype stigma]|uniref:Superoxide dismutase n=1 Tax=Diatrype stigma TaxID=117547 RepID=A0AAN9YW12_9PEZI